MFFLGLALGLGVVSTEETQNQPNILFVLADDLPWDHVGYHGSDVQTPTLDKLAAEGVKLENYYVQPLCTPSRSQLITGRYQVHTGMQHQTIHNGAPWGLPLEFPTLADKLKEVGYSCWTNDVTNFPKVMNLMSSLNCHRRFSIVVLKTLKFEWQCGIYGGAQNYYTHKFCNLDNYCGFCLRDNLEVVREKNGTYAPDLYADRIERIVSEHNKSKPLFLYWPLQLVHRPNKVPQEYFNMYKTENSSNDATHRAAMTAYMDMLLQRITNVFKESGLWNNTVMIFSSDNGGRDGNYPLKGTKTSLWEGGIRSVGFVNSPLLQMKNYTNHELIHISDWFPTLVHLAGGSTEGMGLDGFDQWETISLNEPSPREELLHNIDPLWKTVGERLYPDSFDNRVRAAIRVGDMKLVTGWPDDRRLSKAPESRQHLKNIWLFNITADPNEQQDLSESHPQIVRQLLDRLAYYNSTAVPCLFENTDPQSNPELHGGAWSPWLE